MQPKLAHHPRHPCWHATHASTPPTLPTLSRNPRKHATNATHGSTPPTPSTLAGIARHFSNLNINRMLMLLFKRENIESLKIQKFGRVRS